MPKGQSPYTKYSKTPYRYSDLIYACIKAVKEGKSAEYHRLSAAFWSRYPDLMRNVRRPQ